MTNICNINGVPRKTQTISLKKTRKGANFDIVQNDMSSPNGNANSNVSENNKIDVVNPENKD